MRGVNEVGLGIGVSRSDWTRGELPSCVYRNLRLRNCHRAGNVRLLLAQSGEFGPGPPMSAMGGDEGMLLEGQAGITAVPFMGVLVPMEAKTVRSV